ncbi:hypothetical protein FRC12_023175 [Ceratobasidium sp. 428]|nr:hypothetical protein FRC12_023175 [Ceratobasidium sp. 428]
MPQSGNQQHKSERGRKQAAHALVQPRASVVCRISLKRDRQAREDREWQRGKEKLREVMCEGEVCMVERKVESVMLRLRRDERAKKEGVGDLGDGEGRGGERMTRGVADQ